MAVRDWLNEISYTLLQGSLEEEVTEVIYDSRKAAEKTVFVCMKGARADSHQFIPRFWKQAAVCWWWSIRWRFLRMLR